MDIFLLTEPDPKHVTMFPTGFGDEQYYYDDDGFTRHHPPRTKWSHPYSYDPIELVNTGKEANGSAYSDRMVEWDYEKFHKEMVKLNKGKGELAFKWSGRELVQTFCRSYFNDKSMTITRVIEMCNSGNGYPLWLIYWHSEKDAEIKVIYDACRGTPEKPSQEALDAVTVKYQQYKPDEDVV